MLQPYGLSELSILALHSHVAASYCQLRLSSEVD